MKKRDKQIIDNQIKNDDEAQKIRTRCFELCELPMTATDYVMERDELAENLCRLYMYDNTADSHLWEVLDYIAFMHSICF